MANQAEKTALLLVDHGSRLPEANSYLGVLQSMLQSLRPALQIEIAHLELSPPTIRDGFAACVAGGARHIVVHPYMLSPGRHSTRDIPEAVAKIAADYSGVTFKVTEPLGLHQKLCEIVLERTGL